MEDVKVSKGSRQNGLVTSGEKMALWEECWNLLVEADEVSLRAAATFGLRRNLIPLLVEAWRTF